jgi:peroxiredoxin Q/BCP
MKMMRTIGLIVLAIVGVIGAARGEEGLLAVGAVAPEVVAKDASGAPVRLSAEIKKGHSVVVYFYPKDETTGCTKEACAFRDSYDKFVKAGVTIFAVSRDPEASHQGFREHYHLPFPMVADPSGAVQRAYHVPAIHAGADLAARVSFLVGPDGKIARVWPQVDPVAHAAEVLSAAGALAQTKSKK